MLEGERAALDRLAESLTPAEESDLARMTEAFRANFRLVSIDYFECMARLLSSHSSVAR